MSIARCVRIPRDRRLLESGLLGYTTHEQFQQTCPLSPLSRRCPWTIHHQSPFRGAKSVAKRKVKDLDQGVIKVEPLPSLHVDDGPQYPALLQGVKNNIIKFDKCVVLTAVGKFYELYFEQAEQYGPLLGLKVASRRTALGQVSMAGFPKWQLDRFLQILVSDLNKYVAISEEYPISASDKTRTGSTMYDRRVARVVTPGTLIDEKFLTPYQNNFLLSVYIDGTLTSDASDSADSVHDVGMAWLDLSTGDFFTQTTSRPLLSSFLTRIAPREILLPVSSTAELHDEIKLSIGSSHTLLTLHESASVFTNMMEWNRMLESPLEPCLESSFTIIEKLAAHQLLDYAQSQLRDLQLQLQHPVRRKDAEIITIDRSSLRGLEILETSRDGFGKGSLLHAVKRTATNGGARLLRDRLTSPSASKLEIEHRLDLVSQFYYAQGLCEAIIDHLRRTYDVQRLVQKFTLNKGDADDMLCLARAITEHAEICDLLRNFADEQRHRATNAESGHYGGVLHMLHARFNLAGPVSLSETILKAIDEEGLNRKHRMEDDEAASVATLAQEVVMNVAPEELDSLPKVVRSRSKSKEPDVETEEEPWIMRRSANNTIQRLHEELDLLKAEQIALTKRLRLELSAASLTLKWTPALGHICHLKTTSSFKQSLLESIDARVVSSSKSTKSFYLSDWTRLGAKMEQARLRIREEESQMFSDLRRQVVQNLVHLRRNAGIMDELDVATSFAILAREQGWTRPILNDEPTHKIIGGRHPTVKLGLDEQGRSFVSNDLFLGGNERVWLVTGPNMAGKSTFLRQNALITILAQVGSYVPAEHAEIGLVDQIFSRIGASDDLFRGQSTFMVEMLETAAILKHATPRSFVIMDEVGRGTTPEDGTAVAYASLYHLYYTNRCRTLFATHFHSLADMTSEWAKLGHYCTDIAESKSGSFSFIHKLRKGVNRQSHALRIAKLAGLPDSTLQIAAMTLKQLSGVKAANLNTESLPEGQPPEASTAAG